MLMNLFSIFDPASYFFNLNFMSILMPLLGLAPIYWMSSKKSIFKIKTMMYLSEEMKLLLGGESLGKTLFFVSLIIFIMFNNFLGLFPYIFTYTSHLTMTLALSIPIWLSGMFFGWLSKTHAMLAHLIPPSTSYGLIPFMVCVETISVMIRPLTLAIRLSTNMIAGHLLMVLLSNQAYFNALSLKFLVIFIQISLITLEVGVSVVQSYVFSTLSLLYSADSN